MKRKQIIYIHLIAWSVLFLSEVGLSYTDSRAPQDLPAFLKNLGIQCCYQSIPFSCFYSSYWFVAPQFFVYRQYLRGIIYSLFTLTGIVSLRYLLEYHFFLPVLGFDNYGGHPWPVKDYIENIFFYYFPKYFIYGQLYFFAENWYKDKQLKEELQKEKSTAELAFLRSQINPHFLFNTINDIYSLTYQKAERAPEALLKLSELLRYMLREGNADLMPLRQEIQYLENAIELQRISAKGKAYIHFEMEGDAGDQQVASLLFIPFVENAFKHGILNEPEHPVTIALTAAGESISFSVCNKRNNYQKDHTGGIGLNNVKRRLGLVYPGRHRLEINDGDEFYRVNLVLRTGVCVSVV
ncbi:sensor histidine kinase [Mucilaginibacter sp. L3T2-6]|uniref:sensor histidine kinase n=1 Tax=Mucilaginibacter sp. L3T2-6 TaxID=3062491 RepID=UPI00267543C2|nr:histidine kinase [Mucilaginibacter sp. L3T2-6]MDO3641295.1 histidine kinase [Mucilaginibacter sp. L3T2-6]MDV6213945.1 histidine kinase [Mucilaginibacter sp. L3T2-6]